MFKLLFNKHPLFAEVIKAFQARLEQAKEAYDREITAIDDEAFEKMKQLGYQTDVKKQELAKNIVGTHFNGLV